MTGEQRAPSSRRGGARVFAYAVLGVIGVGLVLAFWSQIEEPASEPAAEATAAEPSAEVAGEPARDGATYGPDDAVVSAAGDRYEPLHVTVEGDDVSVEQPIEVRPVDGPVEVRAPELQLMVDGAPADPIDVDGDDVNSTDGGSYIAFSEAFTVGPGEVEVGDEVTVRVTLDDGTTYDVAGLEVRDGRRSGA